jgi:uncharacterized small protein (DUF1192 family)
MADLTLQNRALLVKRYEYQKMIALTNIQGKEVRMMELEEEIERCKADIAAQIKSIEEYEQNINLQKAEIDKSKSE